MGPAKIILLLLRIALGGVFIYAGAMKIADAPGFAVAIHNYRLTPQPVSVVAALYLPWLEIIAGLALIARKWSLGASLALVGLSAVFLVALTSAWARGLDITCGCFGKGEDKILTRFPQLFLRDVALLGAALTLFIAELRHARAPAVSPNP